MARGGARVGAGRPTKAARATKIDVPKDVSRAARQSGLSPLDYMLTVMNDDTAEDARRDRMAVAAAPFVHAKAEAVEPGKKAQRQASAEKAASEGRFATPSAPKLVVSNK